MLRFVFPFTDRDEGGSDDPLQLYNVNSKDALILIHTLRQQQARGSDPPPEVLRTFCE
jgi:hypothetical protein